MITHRCKNCKWWDHEHLSVSHLPPIEWKPEPGFCRKKIPGAILLFKRHYVGVQPITDAEEFCGEFKENE